MVMYNDLAALDEETLRVFTEPVLKGNVDLVMPVYPAGKYGGLINKSLLAPLSRALYGRRVRWPLPADFCAGANVLTKLAESEDARAQNEPLLLWPSNLVAMYGGQINQAAMKAQHASPADGLDLSDVLSELAGSLFEEAESYAAHWQKVRASQVATRYGEPCPPIEDMSPVDPRPMVESFVNGSRNLEELWRLVLPPATMLELKRLARLEVEQFRMPDALWARIIYDFALAYRMRRVSRTHVLGALTPLYLGWVGSYTQEVADATAQEAERRVEQLARVFEEQKPYLVSRWRWPERVG
jgi:glucosylglycerate synthase